MNLNEQLVKLLCCPFCTAGLEIKKTVRTAPSGVIEAAILECPSCQFEFPVVEGIPILLAPHETVDLKSETTAITSVHGPTVAELNAALYRGDSVGALAMLLNPTKPTGEWFPELTLSDSAVAPKPVPAAPLGNGKAARILRKFENRGKRAIAGKALPHARLRLADFFKVHAESLTAMEVVDLYFRRYSDTEISHYFSYRFGQPRHLVALSLASLFDATDKPVVDFACGLGHVAHFLSNSKPGRTVIGMDRDFVRLWIASQFVAPAAFFVCAAADRPLPFADEALGHIYCSDAFHYFLYRAGSVREMRRVLAREGIMVLGCFGNAIEPREGYELTVPGYSRLFSGMPHSIVGEEALLNAYLERRGPDLAVQEPFEVLETQKWLSLIASHRPGFLRRSEPFESWPHGVGQLRINPIYRVAERRSNGDLCLRFEFPSNWYKFENEHYFRYAPKECILPASLVGAVERGERTPALDPFIAQAVLVGLPERFNV